MQRVLITGSARGLGLEFVRQFLARGDQVFACVRKPDAQAHWMQLAQEHPGKLNVLTLDVLRLDLIAEFSDSVLPHVDALDLLINNAGLLTSGERFGSVDPLNLDQAFRVNAAAPLLLAQELMPMLAKGQRPRVLNISSELGSIAQRSAWYTPSYCISKAALNMATRQMAFALAERGIACAAVHPGWVKTDMGGERAPLQIADAVRDLVAFSDRMSAEHNGGFFSSDGSKLPW